MNICETIKEIHAVCQLRGSKFDARLMLAFNGHRTSDLDHGLRGAHSLADVRDWAAAQNLHRTSPRLRLVVECGAPVLARGPTGWHKSPHHGADFLVARPAQAA